MKVVGNIPRVSGAIKLSTHIIYKVSHWEWWGEGGRSSISPVTLEDSLRPS